VASNWGLPQLGRWDCAANVFQTVANKTGYQNSEVELSNLYFNQSYPGPVSEALWTPGWWPAPNTQAKCASGKGVLPAVKAAWGSTTGSYNYTNVYPYDQLSGINAKGSPVIGSNDRGNSSSGSSPSTTSKPTTTPTPTSSSKPVTTNAAGLVAVPNGMTVLGLVGLIAAFL
jgi:acid phosphatase